MNKDLNWQDLKLFLTVAETGSFSAAARELKLGQPTLSRRIAELEEQLGQPLFIRLSQGCELTALGNKLLPAAQQMAQWSAEVMTEVQSPQTISGCVRITAPPAIAFALLTPFAAELASIYPDIQLEVLSDISTLNLARGEADISLRTQYPQDDDLICLSSFKGDMRVYVSEKHLQKKKDDDWDIRQLKWICWPDKYDYLQVNQVLKRVIPDFKPAFTSNDYNVQLAACCAGVGAMVLPEGFDRNDIVSGLTALPIDLSAYGKGELYLVAHKRQRHLPRIVKIIEQLERFLGEVWPENEA
ncbi:LysR family transcriptional regulator [Oceanospirillum sanctuarii]|uniref:LysR family transcriptional regulator n=1 Tax=Oceanospirillum sanctuarii TaxID=1434821 RepID=UPI000A3BBDCA|nr:LysR family transcriptional regulator [Oceanospirillum sanctuarii]